MEEIERACDAGKPVIAFCMRKGLPQRSSYMDGLFLAKRAPMVTSEEALLANLATSRIDFALRRQRREWEEMRG